MKDGKFEWTLAPTKYATTIHAINSAIIKLSQLTKATTVFRGLAGLRLPQNFFVKNKDGIAGGVEYGFSSTTRHRGTAEFYAKVSKKEQASTIIEVQMGSSRLTFKPGTANLCAALCP